MTTEQYRELYQLLRQYQVENCVHSPRLWEACEVLLDHWQSHYFNQRIEQER